MQDYNPYVRLSIRSHTVSKVQYLSKCCQLCHKEIERQEEYRKTVFLLDGLFIWYVEHWRCLLR